MAYRHRSSNLKQSNKKHKTGKDTSKRRIDRRDNVGGRAISNKRNIGKYAKSTLAVEGRLDRINKTKQNAAKKKAQMLRNKRYAAGSAHGPPRLVTVLSLFESVDNETNTTNTSPITLASDILQEMEHVSTSDASGSKQMLTQHTGMIKKWNSRITLTCFQRTGDDSNDLIALLDILKVTDVILMIVPSTINPDKIIDDFGEQVISSLRAQGFPSIIGVHQMKKSSNMTGKKKNNVRKLLQRFFDTELGDGTKIMEHTYDEANNNNYNNDDIIVTNNINSNGMMDIDTKNTSKNNGNSSLNTATKGKNGTNQHVDQICRYISSLRLKELHFRTMRPYLIVNKIRKEYENNIVGSNSNRYYLSGYVRGKPLNVNQLVHLTGIGTYQMHSIQHAKDPAPFVGRDRKSNQKANKFVNVSDNNISETTRTLCNADESKQESLQQFATINPLAGEQTIFSDAELEEAGFTTNGNMFSPYDNGNSFDNSNNGFVSLIGSDGSSSSTAVASKKNDSSNNNLSFKFPGASETQKIWLDGVMDSEDEEEDYEEYKGLEKFQKEINNGGKQNKDDMKMKGDDDEDDDPDKHALELQRWREKRQELREKQEEDVIFPDEVDTPENIPARERFARYRGLKSFRSSPWDPKESLPLDYAKIFQIEDIAYTQKRLLELNDKIQSLKRTKDMMSLIKKNGSSKKINNDNKKKKNEDAMDMDEDTDNNSNGENELQNIVDDCIGVGQYVTLVLINVDNEQFDKHINNNKLALNFCQPLLLSGLFKHENRMSVVNFTVRKSALCDSTVKSKDVLDIHYGFRRSVCKPIFSENNYNCDKHKFERYLQPGRFVAMTAYLPITYSPAPVLAFRHNVNAKLNLKKEFVLSGSLMSINPDRIILKKIVLSGQPVKVKKKTATVKFMFFNPDDIRWFKPLELWTKHGFSGHIRQPIGTHGSMKCNFNGHIKNHDTVCLTLYKRVYPKYPTEEEINKV